MKLSIEAWVESCPGQTTGILEMTLKRAGYDHSRHAEAFSATLFPGMNEPPCPDRCVVASVSGDEITLFPG